MNMTAEGKGKKGIMLSDLEDNKSEEIKTKQTLTPSLRLGSFSCPGVH